MRQAVREIDVLRGSEGGGSSGGGIQRSRSEDESLQLREARQQRAAVEVEADRIQPQPVGQWKEELQFLMRQLPASQVKFPQLQPSRGLKQSLQLRLSPSMRHTLLARLDEEAMQRQLSKHVETSITQSEVFNGERCEVRQRKKGRQVGMASSKRKMQIAQSAG